MAGFTEGSLKVWFLSPEVFPFAKTGGLADVAGSLPLALKDLGVDVRVGLPFYRMAKDRAPDARKVIADLAVPMGGRVLSCDVLLTHTQDGVPIYFFDRDDFFDREQLYGNPDGDYPDNLDRFAFFSHAALLFSKAVGFGFDVAHCHDWQTGLVPAYLSTLYGNDPYFTPTASVFTIHNVSYQGLFPAALFPGSGLPAEAFQPGGVEFWGKISLLKAGIQYATAVTTVSPSYSREIQTSEFGMGMEGILGHRSSDLVGILNGVDYKGWNPREDKYIAAGFQADNLKGKAVCKSALMEDLGLAKGLKHRPLLAMIARLVPQKGYDLLLEIIDDLLAMNVGIVVLTSGDRAYQDRLSRLAQANAGRMAVKIGFDESLSHRIIAGSDMLLVPSRYEPCGLTQIYALKYGTVPIVRATGGLEDTIRQFDAATGQGNGFKFGPYGAEAFLGQVKEAVATFQNKAIWKKIIRNGMAADFSWKESALQYLSLYEQSLKKRRAGR